ncbi:MAG: SpoIIE family protein phosphatase [Candidatus Krumholzibacteria bacterium]|nr:SpoIIE family protein phosphatase [Candidatus Krumholzibacteria bacterium]
MKAINLKLQITIFVILLIAGLVTAFSLTSARIQQATLLEEVRQKVVLQGRNLALNYAKPLLHEDPEFELHPHIRRVLRGDRNIKKIVVVDREGNIKGHREMKMIDVPFKEDAGFTIVGDMSGLASDESLKIRDDVLLVSTPITDQDETIGTVFIEYSTAGMARTLAEGRKRIMWIGLIALGVGALMSLLLAVLIARPVNHLTRGAELIGQGRLDTRINVKSVREMNILADTFNRMASSLEKSRNVMKEKERLDKELEIARSIQKTLLPSDIPEAEKFDIDAYYNSAELVGGDYYDIIPLVNNRIMFVVGDVAGKGVPGLVVMAMARMMVRDLAQRGENPARLLRHLNALLLKDIRNNMFLTMFCGVLDLESNGFVWASAAHMPFVYFRGRDQSVRMLRTKAKPLGIFHDEIFNKGLEEYRLTFEPGDMLLQYTDGLNEMRDREGAEFGLERVEEIVKRVAPRGAADLLAAIKESLDEFRGEVPQSDDLTLLALRMRQPVEAGVPSDGDEDHGKVSPGIRNWSGV